MRHILDYKNIFDLILLNVVICFIYLFSVILRAILYKRSESLYILVAILILIIFVVNDFFYEYGYIKTGLYFPIGLIIVIFIQSYILIKRFSNAFSFIENL